MLKKITFKEKLSLSQGCSIFVATAVLIAGLILSLLSWSNLNKQLHHNDLNNAQQQLKRLTLAIAPSLLLQDRVSININLQEWSHASDINFIRVLNTSRQTIAEAGRHLTNSTEVSHTITQDNLAIGTIKAEINFNKTKLLVSRHLALGLTITAFFTLLCGLVTYGLCEHYLKYLHKLIYQLNQWQQTTTDDLQLPPTPGLPELRNLHQAVASLAKHQRQQQDKNAAIQQFGSLAFDEKVTAPSANKEQLQYHSCSLLFIEIYNLKELQNTLSAQALTDLLNNYHQLLMQTAKLYGGRLERYAGNGVVVLFGLQSNDTTQAAMHALYAAQLFLGIIEHKRKEAGAALVEFRLACHWGNVLLAPMLNTQAGNHHELVSDTLHWASHLAHNSEDLRLLISQALYEQVKQSDQASWQQGAEVSDLHGQSQATWWLAALEEKQQSLIKRQIRHITTIL